MRGTNPSRRPFRAGHGGRVHEALVRGGGRGGGRIGARLWGRDGHCALRDRDRPRRARRRGLPAPQSSAAGRAVVGRHLPRMPRQYGGLCALNAAAGCRKGCAMAADAGRRAGCPVKCPKQFPRSVRGPPAAGRADGRLDAGPRRCPPLGGWATRAPCALAALPGFAPAAASRLASAPGTDPHAGRALSGRREPTLRHCRSVARPGCAVRPPFALPGRKPLRLPLLRNPPANVARRRPTFWPKLRICAQRLACGSMCKPHDYIPPPSRRPVLHPSPNKGGGGGGAACPLTASVGGPVAAHAECRRPSCRSRCWRRRP